MAFQDKIDLVGIERTGIKLRSNGQNASNSVLQIPKSDGSIVGDEIFGHIKAPNCEYAIEGTATLSGLELGKCYNAPYALTKLHIATGAGTEPVITTDAVQIEENATQSVCTYPIDSLTVSPARHALTFNAFTFTESKDLTLQSSEFDASISLSPTTINGNPIASDSTAGIETVNVTMWATSETTAPDVTVSTGWHLTQDWTCTGADSSLFVWTATFTKYLTANVSQV